MSQQQTSFGSDIDQHIIDDFISEYNSSHSEIESLLLKLEDNPHDDELLNNLFRQVHTIKGNSHFLGLTLLSSFIHSLETVLDKLRKHEINFDKSLGDIVLQAIDLIGELCKNARHPESVDANRIQIIEDDLLNLANSSEENSANLEIGSPVILDNQKQAASKINDQQLEDLKFFARIIENSEQRIPYWAGRSQRLINIALEINTEAGTKVDPAQLEAAIYLHDFGMAFLPFDLIHSDKSLSEQELLTIKRHPAMGAALLDENPIWEQAAMIIVQHHEREDGTGYPHKLDASQICDGAKILAITDTFESMTNQRTNRPTKYPITQAISEINTNAGGQFSEYWVSIFNDVIRNKTQKT